MPQIQYIAGTSIGALIAVLLVISYNSQELEDEILKFDYCQCNAIDLLHLTENFGFDTFEGILKYINNLFTQKNINPQITFRKLYKITKKHLVVNAVCLNTHANTFFDHLQTPNMPVIVGVRASMSLPFMFGSVKYEGLTYVDGGVLNNFSIDLPIFKNDPESVLGINLSNETRYSVKEIDTIDQYVYHLFTCLGHTDDTGSHGVHIINICTPKVQIYDISLSVLQKKDLILLGYQKTTEYFHHGGLCPP